MKTLFHIAIILAAAVFVAGCASAPQTKELDQARTRYIQAENNPKIAKYTPEVLHDAQKELDKAMKAETEEAQRHFAYLAEKKVELAETNAERESIREMAQQLEKQQSDYLLQLRSQEALQAKQKASEAEEQLRSYRTREENTELQQARQKTMETESELQKLQQEMSNMKAQPTAGGVILTLSDIIFEFGKADLKPGAERNLRKLSAFLKNHPDRKVLIEGFTDSVGSAQFNQQLSRERAAAVAQVFQADGIPMNRITTRGLGTNYPVASNETNVGRQQNRRVEITVLNPQENPEEHGRNKHSESQQ